MHIILPKHDVSENELKKLPLFFLIGPIKGGGDWQVRMFIELRKTVGPCHVAIPCRWNEKHALHQYSVGKLGTYARQLEWEQRYIERAFTNKRSCVVAWLPEESKTNSRQDGNPYARDTIGEIEYFRGLLRYDRGLMLVMGGELGFPGLDVIRCNFDYTKKDVFPFYDSIAATAAAAVKKMGE